MPLSKIVKINDKLGWALWRIDSDWKTMLSTHDLNPSFLRSLSKISHPKKKAEHLASRLALSALLENFTLKNKIVEKDGFGKPYLTDESAYISLANSYPYAVAILSIDVPVGIDIEAPTKKLLRVQHKFLHEAEQQLFKNDEHKICLAWCAKESLYKLYGRKKLSFKQHICVSDISFPNCKSFTGSIHYASYSSDHILQVEKIEPFYIVFSM